MLNKKEIEMIKELERYENLSKCSAKKVACILTKEINKNLVIVSVGVNGTIPKKLNCNDIWERVTINYQNYWYNKVTKEYSKDGHSKWSLLNEIHAEMNGIAKTEVPDGCIAFVTYSPCNNCAKLLARYGVKKIIFKNKYDDWDEVKEFLEDCGIECVDYNE